MSDLALALDSAPIAQAMGCRCPGARLHYIVVNA
jgi:hypothetical protein